MTQKRQQGAAAATWNRMSSGNCSVNTGQQWLQLLLLYLYTSLVFLCPALLSSVALETEFQGPFTAWLQATTLLHADGEPAEGAPTLSSGCTSPGLP